MPRIALTPAFAQLALLSVSIGISGCHSSDLNKDLKKAETTLGSNNTLAQPSDSPEGGSSKRTLGESCHSDDPNHICLGLKYVAYHGPDGAPTISQEQVIQTVNEINQLWSPCNLAFQIDRYVSVEPKDYDLRYSTADTGELDQIRRAFEENSTLLVATTGTWARTGSIGWTGANAWTNLPGSGDHGVVLERPVALYANIVAHELGHYLNLDHVNDRSAVMNPLVYSGSNRFYPSQCEAARQAATYFWAAMLR